MDPGPLGQRPLHPRKRGQSWQIGSLAVTVLPWPGVGGAEQLCDRVQEHVRWSTVKPCACAYPQEGGAAIAGTAGWEGWSSPGASLCCGACLRALGQKPLPGQAELPPASPALMDTGTARFQGCARTVGPSHAHPCPGIPGEPPVPPAPPRASRLGASETAAPSLGLCQQCGACQPLGLLSGCEVRGGERGPAHSSVLLARSGGSGTAGPVGG